MSHNLSVAFSVSAYLSVLAFGPTKMKELLFISVAVFLLCKVESKYCRPGDNSPGCEQCPPEEPWTECTPDPCEREKEAGCPLHKHDNPVCRSKPCGGCYDEWFLSDGTQVWCWAF